MFIKLSVYRQITSKKRVTINFLKTERHPVLGEAARWRLHFAFSDVKKVKLCCTIN